MNIRTALRPLLRFAVIALVLAGVPWALLPAAAQTGATGQIVGSVSDPSGAVVPHAVAIVTDIATGAVRTASTNGVGIYTVPLLPPGNYAVSMTASGFKKATNTSVAVSAAT
ncbi:MAG: carboxypeptidase-like regulatory domain-containing protein, partial [Terriglobales bacterium]